MLAELNTLLLKSVDVAFLRRAQCLSLGTAMAKANVQGKCKVTQAKKQQKVKSRDTMTVTVSTLTGNLVTMQVAKGMLAGECKARSLLADTWELRHTN